MIVKVTQEHIDKGKRINCYQCPVALALLDAFKVRRFIHNFDEGRSVKPFEFELSLEGVKL